MDATVAHKHDGKKRFSSMLINVVHKNHTLKAVLMTGFFCHGNCGRDICTFVCYLFPAGVPRDYACICLYAR